MSETQTASPYMTTPELALLIRRTPQAIRQMRTRGTAPQGTRFGRQVLFHRDDVWAWLEAKRDTDPLLFYRPEVQAWLAKRRINASLHQLAASAA